MAYDVAEEIRSGAQRWIRKTRFQHGGCVPYAEAPFESERRIFPGQHTSSVVRTLQNMNDSLRGYEINLRCSDYVTPTQNG